MWRTPAVHSHSRLFLFEVRKRASCSLFLFEALLLSEFCAPPMSRSRDIITTISWAISSRQQWSPPVPRKKGTRPAAVSYFSGRHSLLIMGERQACAWSSPGRYMLRNGQKDWCSALCFVFEICLALSAVTIVAASKSEQGFSCA